MKVFSLVLAVLLLPVFIFGADSTNTGWNRSMVLDITTTQTGYSDSWVGGEAGSLNWVANLNSLAQKQMSPKFNFKSTLKLSFGQTKTQDAETKEWSDAVKSTDLIDFENVGEFTLGGFVDPYVAFRVETQFYDGSNPAKKQYFSPMKLTESAGVLKHLYKKEKQFVTTRLGFGMRQILKSTVDSTLTSFDTTLNDGGIESVTDAVLKLSERMTYTGKLTLYKAFYFSESDAIKGQENEDYWKAVDINWENIIAAQVSKVITVNLYTQLLYDKEISKKGRFKETIAVGFVFKLI